jgi:integrase
MVPDMDIVAHYLRAGQARRLSPETLRTTRSVLGGLSRHARVPLLELTPEQLLDWQAERAMRVSALTLRSNVGTVRVFYRWACEEGWLDADPTRRMRTPRVPRLLPRPIPEDRLGRAMEAADPEMRVALGLAAFAGLRAGEVASIAWADLFLDGPEPYLRVVGKGSRERVVDVSPALLGVAVGVAAAAWAGGAAS